jgi:copper resistance protein B
MLKGSRFSYAVLGLIGANAALAADDDIYAFLQADRFEYAESPDAYIWDLQGWVGDDYRKFWFKSEGEYEDGSTAGNEIQLLYSRAWTPFFDWQLGLRYDVDPTPSRAHLVIGMQGLAPQWFEVDAAVFLSEDGDFSARLEAEYDLLLTQRLVLQPRLELELSASDLPELGIGSGITSSELGLRLRYEFHRKFAPYLGVNWTKLYGGTADYADDDDDVSAIIGLRLWY